MGMEGCGVLYQKELEVAMLFLFGGDTLCRPRKSTIYQIGYTLPDVLLLIYIQRVFWVLGI